MIVPSNVREALKAEIAEQVRVGDSRDWKALRDRYPEIPPATFWRYVKMARDGRPDGERVAAARRELSSAVAGQLSGAAPAPASAPRETLQAPTTMRELDLLPRVIQLLDDIALLRGYAMRDGAIMRPQFFAQSIGLKDRALQTAMRLADASLAAEAQAEFFDALVEEIAAESPVTAHRIIIRLRLLQGLKVGTAAEHDPEV